MSGRSSARELARSAAALALAAAACGSSGGAAPLAPEADPARVTTWAKAMIANAPGPGSVRECAPADLANAVPMTQNALLRLAGATVPNDAEHLAWINPPELDGPGVAALLAAAPGSPAARQAAAQVLTPGGAVVYRVDNLDAPLAMGVKELKIGTVGARAIRYDGKGVPVCATLFFVQNDKQVSAKAIAASDHAIVDPSVAEGLRADLRARYVAAVPRATP